MPVKPSISNDLVDRAISHLDEDGFFTDENSNIGSHILEKHTQHLENCLSARGYKGGSLFVTADNVQNEGWVYFAFDTNKFEVDEAIEFVRALKAKRK